MSDSRNTPHTHPQATTGGARRRSVAPEALSYAPVVAARLVARVTDPGEVLVLHLDGERVAMGFAGEPVVEVAGSTLPSLDIAQASIAGGRRQWREVRRMNDFTSEELELLHQSDFAGPLDLWVGIHAEVERITIPVGSIALAATPIYRVDPQGYRGGAPSLERLDVHSIELAPAPGLGIEPRRLGGQRITSHQTIRAMGYFLLVLLALAVVVALVGR